MLFIAGFLIGFFVVKGLEVETEDVKDSTIKGLQGRVDHLETQVIFHKDANNMLVKRIKGE